MPLRAALEKLKRDLIAMAEMCENSFDTALMALVENDSSMANQVVSYDRDLDNMELAVDRDCMRLLSDPALDASGRRFAAVAMKINNDLERIGDEAVELANRALFLAQEQAIIHQVIDFASLVEQAEQMTSESVRALVENDATLAWKVVEERDVVQEEMRTIVGEIVGVMQESPATVERAVHVLAAARSLEKAATYAAHIAEEVVFLIEGKAVQAKPRNYRPLDKHLLRIAASAEEKSKQETAILERRSKSAKKK